MSLPSNVDLDQNAKIRALEGQLTELRVEIAERRPVGQLIQYMFYFFGAIAVIIGIFGIRELSDISNVVKSEIQPDLQDLVSDEYESRGIQVREANSFFTGLDIERERASKTIAELERVISELKKVREFRNSSDVEGEIARIASEVSFRAEREPNFQNGEGSAFDDTIWEEAWRKSVEDRIRKMLDSPDIRNVAPDEIFNAAQDMRRINNRNLTLALLESLPIDEGRPEIEALRLATLAAQATGVERDQAYSQLLELTESLGERSPHIVLAEIWNATETLRRYSELIEHLQTYKRERKASGLPNLSYLNALLAQSYFRRGFEGDLDQAFIEAGLAEEILAKESLANQWFESTQDILNNLAIIKDLRALQ